MLWAWHVDKVKLHQIRLGHKECYSLSSMGHLQDEWKDTLLIELTSNLTYKNLKHRTYTYICFILWRNRGWSPQTIWSPVSPGSGSHRKWCNNDKKFSIWSEYCFVTHLLNYCTIYCSNRKWMLLAFWPQYI